MGLLLLLGLISTACGHKGPVYPTLEQAPETQATRSSSGIARGSVRSEPVRSTVPTRTPFLGEEAALATTRRFFFFLSQRDGDGASSLLSQDASFRMSSGGARLPANVALVKLLDAIPKTRINPNPASPVPSTKISGGGALRLVQIEDVRIKDDDPFPTITARVAGPPELEGFWTLTFERDSTEPRLSEIALPAESH